MNNFLRCLIAHWSKLYIAFHKFEQGVCVGMYTLLFAPVCAWISVWIVHNWVKEAWMLLSFWTLTSLAAYLYDLILNILINASGHINVYRKEGDIFCHRVWEVICLHSRILFYMKTYNRIFELIFLKVWTIYIKSLRIFFFSVMFFCSLLPFFNMKGRNSLYVHDSQYIVPAAKNISPFSITVFHPMTSCRCSLSLLTYLHLFLHDFCVNILN